MRGIARLSESICSHLACPSCRRQQPSLFGRYSSQLWTAPQSAGRGIRHWTNKAEPSPDTESSRTARFVNDPQFLQNRVVTPGASAPGILEAGYNVESETLHELASKSELATLVAEFNCILEGGQPDQVMAALRDPRFADLVGSMPQSTFVEAFHLLSPAYFVDPYKEIHRPLHPSAVDIKQYRSLDSIFDEFASNLAVIISTRRSAGHVLGLAEYTHLLDCARSLGDSLMADHIWHTMTEDEVVPDTTCYNYYMETKAWDTTFTGLEKYRLRMTPFLYRKRRFDTPSPGWQGYGTGRRSVRREVLRIFNEMTEVDTHGDQDSFVNVILASGRVGHVNGIKNVLKTVWNVDVDALQKYDEASLPEVIPYDRSSPLYPTGRLLFAVAHAFGTNNDIPAALRVIEFISNSYDITVPETIWLELFERSFVLSRPRFGPDARRNSRGKVSYEFLNNMLQTMTSEPFNVRPTIEVHHILAKSAWDQSDLADFQHHLRAAYDILRDTRRKRMAARSVLESYLAQSRAQDSESDPVLLRSRAFSDAVHTYDILRLRVAQQTITIERLAKLLLIHRRWMGRNNPLWERQLLPRVLEEWRDFLPTSLIYSTPGGLVQFHGTTNWGQGRPTRHRKPPVRRPTVDNNLKLEKQHGVIDDDIFWKNYRKSYPQLNLDSPALKRLFVAHPISDAFSDNATSDEDTLLAERLEYEVKNEFSFASREIAPRSDTATEQSSHSRQREEEYDDHLGTSPGNYSMT